MTSIKRIIVSSALMLMGLIGLAGISAAPVQAACGGNFLSFPPWYAGVINESTCEVEVPTSGKTAESLGGFIWRIVLNVINIVLQIIGYASLGFIIYGGFRYLTSSGSADKVTAARKTIMNAVVGLAISFFSVVIVTLIAGRITP